MAEAQGDQESFEKREPASRMSEVGVSGLRFNTGFVEEEFLRDLRGERGIKMFREMSSNDSTASAVLFAIGLILRAVKWEAEPAPDVPDDQAQAEADFALSLFDDMSHTWEDLIGEVMTMLVYGWSYFETVLKRRIGPLEASPEKRSKFTDGRIGIRKLAPRAQDSLVRWELQDDGGIEGMWQQSPNIMVSGGEVLIDIERSLLFRTVSRKNSPEGVSILRGAYRPWYFLKKVQEFEAIGIERELAGLPVISIPTATLEGTDAASVTVRTTVTKMARDIRMNHQAGCVISSDVFADSEGKLSTARKMSIELLKAGGARAIDTISVKTGYQRDIARAALADFLMLGTDKGAFNLSESKQTLFMKACEAFLAEVAAPINRFLLPRIWDYNGLDRALLPKMKPGRIAPFNFAAVGAFLRDIAGAGADVFPNDDLTDFLLEEADLPRRSAEVLLSQQDVKAAQEEAAAAARAALAGGGGPKPEGETAPEIVEKALTRTLYVSRDLLNGEDVRAWAKTQGFTSALPENDMHVTIAFSRQAVDWREVGQGPPSVTVVGGAREIKALGDNGDAIVLAFAAPELAARWAEIKAAGATWDYPEYNPHVSITYKAGENFDIAKVEPYSGPLIFGPERFGPLPENWKKKIVEDDL